MAAVCAATSLLLWLYTASKVEQQMAYWLGITKLYMGGFKECKRLCWFHLSLALL